MTILSTVQDAAVMSLGLERPSVLYTSTTRTWQEMCAVVNESVSQILDDYDWNRLYTVATIVGDGVSTAFNLPDDYNRMVPDTNLHGQTVTYYPAEQIQDFNEWLRLISLPIQSWEKRWSVFGGNLNILPILPAGEVLTYGYVSKNMVNGKTQEFPVSDTDTFTLDERLLKLSVIWNWKANKGQDYAGDLQKYEEAMNRAKFKDPGARQTIYSGRGRRWPTGQSFP